MLRHGALAFILLGAISGCDHLLVEPARTGPAGLALSYALDGSAAVDRARVVVIGEDIILDTLITIGPENETTLRLTMPSVNPGLIHRVAVEIRAEDNSALFYGSTFVHFKVGSTAFADVNVSRSPRQTLAAGSKHTCVLDDDSRAHCWGLNDQGQLGTGDRIASARPLTVANDHRFIEIVAYGSGTCGLTFGGEVYCWGAYGLGPSQNAPTRVAVKDDLRLTTITLGAHLCGLDATGKAHCAGANRFGQLGTGDTIRSDIPREVAAAVQFKAISAGLVATCALALDGRAFCWGSNTYQQTGTGGTSAPVLSPTPVAGNQLFLQVQTGATVSCGIVQGAATLCWGIDYFGSLGQGRAGTPLGTLTVRTPTQLANGVTFSRIRLGSENNIFTPVCATNLVGVASCWGANSRGQLGVASTPETCTNGPNQTFGCSGTPLPVAAGLRFSLVMPGGEHTCGLTRDQRLFCWGLNDFGQLGTGNTTSSTLPVPVPVPFVLPE